MNKDAIKKEEKTYTETELQQKLAVSKNEIRDEVIQAMARKQTELKSELMQLGSDEYYNPAKWEVMKKMAEDMVRSGALPKTDNAYTVLMKLQAGREMGLKPIEAVKSFYIVNGILNIYGSAVTRRLREHGWRIKFDDKFNACTATVSKEDESYTDTLTFEEAKKSGWTESFGKLKPGWVDGINRKTKLRYGVLSLIIKTCLSEVLGSAVDIAEVAEDTTPVINGTNKLRSKNTIAEDDYNKPATEQQKNVIRQYDDKADIENMKYGEAVDKIKELTQHE